MATYTANLRLVTQANGENVNTWGATLNTGMIALIDSAVSGSQTISLAGGNVTLTANNGAADQARSAALIFTGALPSNVVVTVPAVPKLYVVQNNTTVNYSVTVTPSGGTGLAVAQGAVVLIWSDGSTMRLVAPAAVTNIANLGGIPAASYARQDVLSTFRLVRLVRGPQINVSGSNYNTNAQQLQSTATATAGANIGNGTFGTISVADPAQVGKYTLTMTSSINYNVNDTTGALVNTGTTGSQFNSGGLTFTLTAGGTAFVSGDNFTIQTSIFGSNYFPVNMTVNGTLTNPINLGTDVQGFTWRIKQDATGGRTLAYGTMFKFLNSTVPALSTGPNAVDMLQGIFDPTDNLIYCVMSKNFG